MCNISAWDSCQPKLHHCVPPQLFWGVLSRRRESSENNMSRRLPATVLTCLLHPTVSVCYYGILQRTFPTGSQVVPFYRGPPLFPTSVLPFYRGPSLFSSWTVPFYRGLPLLPTWVVQFYRGPPLFPTWIMSFYRGPTLFPTSVLPFYRGPSLFSTWTVQFYRGPSLFSTWAPNFKNRLEGYP